MSIWTYEAREREESKRGELCTVVHSIEGKQEVIRIH